MPRLPPNRDTWIEAQCAFGQGWLQGMLGPRQCGQWIWESGGGPRAPLSVGSRLHSLPACSPHGSRGTILKRKWHCISPPLRDLFCGLQVPSKWNPNSLPRPQTAAGAYKCSIYKAMTHTIRSQSCVRARKARPSIRGQFPGLKVLFLYLSHTRKVPQCASKSPRFVLTLRRCHTAQPPPLRGCWLQAEAENPVGRANWPPGQAVALTGGRGAPGELSPSAGSFSGLF